MALKLTMTCGPYDRARALIDGTVKPEGIDLEVYVNQDPGRHTKIEAGSSILPNSIPAFTSPISITSRSAIPLFLFS
jgi:hypothetical protein